MKQHIYLAPLSGLITDPWFKGLLAGLLTLLVETFSTDGALVLSVFVLVFIDTATGVSAAVSRNEVVSSYGLRRTIMKLLQYMAVLYGAIIIGNTFSGYLFWLPEFTSAYIVITEFRSVVENVGMVDYWTKIKDRLFPGEDDIKPKKEEDAQD